MTLVLNRQTAFQKPTHPDSATIQCKFWRTQLRTERRAACNSGFEKKSGLSG